jgi:hypothetical protein
MIHQFLLVVTDLHGITSQKTERFVTFRYYIIRTFILRWFQVLNANMATTLIYVIYLDNKDI